MHEILLPEPQPQARQVSSLPVSPTVASKVMVRAENVWKGLPTGNLLVPVLRGIELTVYAGEVVALVGPSGSGKTTLLGLLGGLDTPTQGRLVVDDYEISRLPERKLAAIRNTRIGFVFQFFNLIPALTVLENVVLPAQFSAKPIARRPEPAARELLHQVGLGDKCERKPSELSGGEQQRVAIARALINEPSLLLADEPTGNLDSATGATILDLLFDLRRTRNLTCIITTHDPAIAARADRIIKLHDGICV